MAPAPDGALRALFAEEATQRLEELVSGLLRLERGPDREVVDALFREAHTLKGAAAVVGIEEVRSVSHVMESLLERVRSGTIEVTPELVDLLLGAVDGLQEMLPAVLNGEDRRAEASELATRLDVEVDAPPSGASPTGADRSSPVGDAHAGSPAEIESGVGDQEVISTTVIAPTSERVARGSGDETMRVPITRLEELDRLAGESAAASLRVARLVSQRLGADPSSIDELRDLSRAHHELLARSKRTRMVPVSTVTEVLHRAIRDAARLTGKHVRWEVVGSETELDRGVLQQLSDPLLHIVRNAVDHGVESPGERASTGKPREACIRLTASNVGSEVVLTVSDDGLGIDLARVRQAAARRGEDTSGLSDDEAMYLLFRSGLSTSTAVSELSGRGVGLDVVRDRVVAAGGRIEVETEAGRGTTFRLIVPTSMAVVQCMVVEVQGRTFALPLHAIDLALEHPARSVLDGRDVVLVGDVWMPAVSLGDVLGLGTTSDGPVLVLAGATRRHAFVVDRLAGQRDIVVKGLSPLLPDVGMLAGASMEHDGSIFLLLDHAGLIDRARQQGDLGEGEADAPLVTTADLAPRRRARLLVVEDSPVVRLLERSILERAGYEVTTAVDGADALDQLETATFDLVLTDIEMPHVDGFALTEAVRRHPVHRNLPVVVLTSRVSEEDRRRGLDAGADGWFVKSSFDEARLLAAVDRLLGT